MQALLDDLRPELSDPQLALEVLIESAWLALEEGRVDAAESAARTALSLAPADRKGGQGAGGAEGAAALGEVCFFVGEARYAAGEHAGAAALYEEAARRAGGTPRAQALYKLGFARLALEDWNRAAQAFEALVRDHAGTELAAEGLYLQGEAHFRAGQYAAAVEPLERLTRESPAHAAVPRALFRLGLAHGEEGRWKPCEAALSELARRAPDFELAAEAELWRGRALAALGDRRSAQAAFERVVARDKTVLAARARLELGRLALEAGDAEGALAEFLKVALLFADGEEVSEALYLAGTALEHLGDTDKAKAQYRELIEEHPDTTAAARAKERLGELGS
jgi:TolA-binding protein